MKVVSSGYKTDLHIHSTFSSHKDHEKVTCNTIDNIDVLKNRLNENKVQICAITDHDMFNYTIYKKLKELENDTDSSVEKVLPGIEFSVEYTGDNKPKTVHVIAIFNDEDDEKVMKISDCIPIKSEKPDYDRCNAFSEEKFLLILKKIGLDTVLIAHQKSSIDSSVPYKNDATSVGKEKFYDFIYTDYFEAYEFKNRRNEVFNKNYLSINQMTDNVRFITGSDCHDWNYYPKRDVDDNTEFVFSYLKCLPTFRGLVMAITDHRRIKTQNSFFNTSSKYVDSIDIEINKSEVHIPLSKGINVIIGDNSIGKSLLLHKMCGYRKKSRNLLTSSMCQGYDKYLKNNSILIKTEIPESELFMFDMQGEIRDKFNNGSIKTDDFLKDYFPPKISPDKYIEIINREIDKVINYLRLRFEISRQEYLLEKIDLLIGDDYDKAESISFVGNAIKNTEGVKNLNSLLSNFETINEKWETILENPELDGRDKIEIERIKNSISLIASNYADKLNRITTENDRVSKFNAAIDAFNERYKQNVSDTQKLISSFHESMNSAAEEISSILRKRQKISSFDISLNTEEIQPLTERIYNYVFVSKLRIDKIGKDYLLNLLQAPLKKGSKPVLEMNYEELCEAIAYNSNANQDVLESYRSKINLQIEKDLSDVMSIIEDGVDTTLAMSSGINSKIYFDILSYDTKKKGIYIIDQPEDNVSQKAIREYLLDRFKVMGENRQVLIVTHNPQFIVNLDVDNVIYLGKNKNGFFVQSGALEYKNKDYNILDIVSTHIEGGLDTLKRRWKRYEKSNNIF